MTNPLENKMNRAAETIEPSAEFSQALWNQIRMTPRKENAPKRVSRFVWIPALTVLGILAVMVFVAPQSVLAAVKSLLAYIPGIGFVQKDETTLYLEKPVIVEQNGYTFTLDQVVADKEKVVVAYHMISPSSNFNNCAYGGNYLLGPDGKSNRPIGGGGGSTPEGGMSGQIEYFPLPAGVTQASVKVTFDPDLSVGCTAPKEWIVPFTLGTEVPVTEILPVVENVTEQSSMPLVSQSKDAPVQLTVDGVDELADGYLITGHIEYDKKYWTNVSISTRTLYALDANGKKVAIEQGNSSINNNGFTLHVTDKDFVAPLSIHVKDLYVQAYDENGSTFSFDAGSDPQMDQNWKINQEMTYAGKKYSVQEVKVIHGNYDFDPKTVEVAYGISMKLPEGFGVLMDCVAQDGIHSIGNVAKPVVDGEYTAEVDYKDGIPNGKVTCKALNGSYMESGDWQFDWQPPVSTLGVSPSPSSSDSPVQFIVDKYVEMADGYLLTGHMIAQDESWQSVSIDTTTLSAQDANGNIMPLEQPDVNLKENEFAIKVATKDFTGPISIHVKQLSVNVNEEKGPSFSFDAGSDPQVGQSWNINQELEIAGVKIKVHDVKTIEGSDNLVQKTKEKGYTISVSVTASVNFSFDCVGKEGNLLSSYGTMSSNEKDFELENFFGGELPTGTVTCKINNAFVFSSGDWSFDWQPTVQ